MKIFLENYNGVLDSVEDYLDDSGELTDNPHEADAFVLWQDVRGVCRELALLAKHQLKKPVIVMQHGRGATRDYGAPNNFQLVADKILVWGPSEKDRLLRYGIKEERIEVVGCPLFSAVKPRAAGREGKNVLYVPVIGQKEEPENILVYAALKIWESEKLIKTVQDNFTGMKKSWAWEENLLREVPLPDGTKERRLWKKEVRHVLPRWLTYGAGLVNVKLSGVHDMQQYQSPIIVTQQNDPSLVEYLTNTLANIDVVVCLEEGTLQLLACAADIPIINVDIFRYGDYGGCKDYDKVEKIQTNSVLRLTDINKLGSAIDRVMANPQELARHRKLVCELEGGQNLGVARDNAIRAIRACVERPQAAQVAA